MARKHEAVTYLNQGRSPAAIADAMGISFDSVMGYLYNQVGEGRIRRSDILFAIENKTREAARAIESEYGMLESGPFRRLVKSKYPEVNADEAWAYRTLKRPEVDLGDSIGISTPWNRSFILS